MNPGKTERPTGEFLPVQHYAPDNHIESDCPESHIIAAKFGKDSSDKEANDPRHYRSDDHREKEIDVMSCRENSGGIRTDAEKSCMRNRDDARVAHREVEREPEYGVDADQYCQMNYVFHPVRNRTPDAWCVPPRYCG